MMKFRLLGIGITAGLSIFGCSQEENTAFEQGDIVVYECSDGSVLTVRLNESWAIADLPEQNNIALLPIESEFGDKYSDGTTTLQVKGQVASVENSGVIQYPSCQSTEAEATSEDVFSALDVNEDIPYAERCEIYPLKSNEALTVPCYFLQQGGAIYIGRADGVTYQLEPTSTQSGIYLDADGNEAYRQAGLGDDGQIYRLATETVYVYWSTVDEDDSLDSVITTFSKGDRESANITYIPATTTQIIDADIIAMRIVDEDWVFDGFLELADGERFRAEAEDIIVLFEPATGQVNILNSDTSATLYDYSIGPLDLESFTAESLESQEEASSPESSGASE